MHFYYLIRIILFLFPFLFLKFYQNHWKAILSISDHLSFVWLTELQNKCASLHWIEKKQTRFEEASGRSDTKRFENLNGTPRWLRADLHGERAFRSSRNPTEVGPTTNEGDGLGSDRDEQPPG